MGFWQKAAGFGVGLAGAVTGQPALIGAGASIIGADVTAEGAKKAAQQQMDAAEKARADANARYDATKQEQRAIYDQSSAAFQPFIGLGQGVLPNLGSMVGLSPAATPTMIPNVTGTTPTGLEPAAVDTSGGVQSMTQAPAQARAERQTASAYGKRGDGGLRLANLGGLVLVQSPDGMEKQLLTRARADDALARGAREVS